MLGKSMAAATATALSLALALAAPSRAQDLSSSISCLNGSVPAADYAELAQKLQESFWDRRGGVTLVTSIGGVSLRVLDMNGQSVCENEANNSTYCQFRLSFEVVDEFNIIIDNATNAEAITYRICAY